MPKSKAAEKNGDLEIKNPAEEAEKIIEIDEEAVDDDLVEDESIPEEGEDDEVLDADEVDPFNDKWEQ